MIYQISEKRSTPIFNEYLTFIAKISHITPTEKDEEKADDADAYQEQYAADDDDDDDDDDEEEEEEEEDEDAGGAETLVKDDPNHPGAQEPPAEDVSESLGIQY